MEKNKYSAIFWSICAGLTFTVAFLMCGSLSSFLFPFIHSSKQPETVGKEKVSVHQDCFQGHLYGEMMAAFGHHVAALLPGRA